MPYTPALDGLRAVAILLVVLFHARAPFASGGFLGVDVFFVLSGYLITALLLEERHATGQVDLRRFYWRRVLRLVPALMTMLLVYVAVAPLLWPGTTDHFFQAVLAAAYIADYAHAFWGTPSLVGHTWSLSVEEHFYLLWPVILLVCWRRWSARTILIVLGIAYVAATAWRWACFADGQSWRLVYYRFDTRLSGLILGAWLAAAGRVPSVWNALRRLPSPAWWLPVVALILVLFEWGNVWMGRWAFTVVELFTASAIIATTAGGITARALSVRPLVWLGVLSYGIYLWHYPVFRFLRENLPWDRVLIIGLPLSVAVAYLSFHTVEAWARRWRSRVLFRPDTVEAGRVKPVAGLGREPVSR